MESIILPKGQWFYDPTKPVGKAGGFGAVFRGSSQTHGDIAVKRLHLDAAAAAHREIEIATDLAARSLSKVVPILDAGKDEHSGNYFVIMLMAERSLQQDIDEVSFSEIKAARVMLDIIDGLIEVKDIVHRDLKPANILFHDNSWKVSDFGIARFVEEATSLHTLKGCLSPAFAAPEQFRYERATGATDIYSLGCIGYALLTGRPPFTGPDFSRQHQLDVQLPLPTDIAPKLQVLIEMMLRKSAASRPSLERVRNVLLDTIRPNGAVAGHSALSRAAAQIASEQSRRDQWAQRMQAAESERNNLASEARAVLRKLLDRLSDHILREAPNAERDKLAVTLGNGHLEASLAGTHGHAPRFAEQANLFRRSKWDVVATEQIVVHQSRPPYRWSSSLYYCQLPDTDDFRWYEVAYCFNVGQSAVEYAPFSLANKYDDADLAASAVMHTYGLAFGPTAIDDENEEDFIDRWATLLAIAAQGKLGYPRYLPLRGKFWNQNFVA